MQKSLHLYLVCEEWLVSKCVKIRHSLSFKCYLFWICLSVIPPSLRTRLVRLSFSYLFVKVISVYAERKVRRSQSSSWSFSNSAKRFGLSSSCVILRSYLPISLLYNFLIVLRAVTCEFTITFHIWESQWSKSSPITEILLGPFLIRKSFLIWNSCSFVEFN